MDRFIAIKKGCVAFDGATRSLMRRKTLAKIFDTHFVLATHPITGCPCIVPGSKPA